MRGRTNIVPRLAVAALTAVLVSVLAGACRVDTFDTSPCGEASDAARRFYSFHLGNDMTPSPENLEKRKKYLTDELFKQLSGINSKQDYFTASENFPRTFKIGHCTQNSAEDATVQVQIYWKDDYTTEQKDVLVDVAKRGGEWLINKVSPDPNSK
ncbi:MAG TPA: hypothetical protein PKC65_12405 [Pyrinomonadaceae bacterium]|nr:hypothetical protein [Pyrinomonadaceae bacterium]